jgi:hypothetical protein
VFQPPRMFIATHDAENPQMSGADAERRLKEARYATPVRLEFTSGQHAPAVRKAAAGLGALVFCPRSPRYPARLLFYTCASHQTDAYTRLSRIALTRSVSSSLVP